MIQIKLFMLLTGLRKRDSKMNLHGHLLTDLRRKSLIWRYPITPQAPIDSLKEHLHQARVFKGFKYYRRTIPAHMTIGEFVTIEQSWKIVEEIKDIAPSGSFLCDKLDLIVPDINMQFHRVKSYSLGESKQTPTSQYTGIFHGCAA